MSYAEEDYNHLDRELSRAMDRIEALTAEVERLQHENQELRSENARLREAGRKLNDHACHDDDCQIVTHGVWSDPIPCTCGYTEAWKAWSAALEDRGCACGAWDDYKSITSARAVEIVRELQELG